MCIRDRKGADIDLRHGYKQSDGSMLTPYQQARRYAGYLPHDMNPRWIVVCNFRESVSYTHLDVYKRQDQYRDSS